MHRINVDKKEDIASLIDRLIDLEGDKVTIVIPNNSQIAEVEANFRLLAREAASDKKEILIESIDEKVLGYAHKYGLSAEHPLFQNNKDHHSLSDIVVQPSEHSVAHHKAVKVKAHHTPTSEIENPEGEELEPEEVEDEEEVVVTHAHHRERREEKFEKRDRAQWTKKAVWAGAGLGSVLVILGVFGMWFGKVTVSLAFIKTPFEENLVVTAQKDLEVANAENSTIPAVLFTEEKNLIQTFKASGRERVAKKAKAKVTIYNAYNSKPQILVATTRFQTPDGKIFRLDSQVTVPGAKIEDGKIVPAGIEASVTADEAGEAYNIGPVSKLTIPGFKGTDRYEGFYASLDVKAEGGMVGEAPVSTETDIKNAEEKTREALLAAVSGSLARRLPEEYKTLEGATKTEVTKLSVNTDTDASGNFSVFGEAQQSVLVFREKDLLYLAGEKLQATAKQKEVQEPQFDYTNIQASFDDGKLTFNVVIKGVLVSPFASGEFEDKLAGQSIDTLKRELASVSGVSEAKFFIYPPWIWNVPGNPDRIDVEVN
ncbi:MAG: hypothetical protein KGZ30_04325 [Anaplasmataceae bacterium]|nr:hypothetical protein [Anaplasmataceae bacterium]